MKKKPIVLQINSVVGYGSTGRIAEELGKAVKKRGWEPYIAYGRKGLVSSESKLVKISNRTDVLFHVLVTRVFDIHGFVSRHTTRKFLNRLEKIKPDIIHLHNIHGYYINIKLLFKWLREKDVPVVWTLHDCWPITGHCSHFDYVECYKWQSICMKCPQKNKYPKSLILDNSKNNFVRKKVIFNSINKLTLIPVSNWLNDIIKLSYLSRFNSIVIHNGIDVNSFSPKKNNHIKEKYKITDKYLLLGVAGQWSKRKGLQDIIKLNDILDNNYVIMIVGVTKKQAKLLPKNIITMTSTNSTSELAGIYSSADIYINTTYEDNYPTTNLESISCGTPVITYATGGSIESVTKKTGCVVEKGNIKELKKVIIEMASNQKENYFQNCREYAINNFNSENQFLKYMEIYDKILKRGNVC